jgi:hypothetical protein
MHSLVQRVPSFRVEQALKTLLVWVQLQVRLPQQ